jgi:hypothetical protein
MRRFLAGLLIGMAGMYWYAYQKDSFFDQVRIWLAVASHDSGAPQKVDKMFPGKR